MESGRPYSRLLMRLPPMTNLRKADKLLVAALPLTVTNIPAGGQIARFDEPQCVLVVSGFVCGYKRVGMSRRQITSLFVPGDIAGLHGLLLPSSNDSLSALGAAVI